MRITQLAVVLLLIAAGCRKASNDQPKGGSNQGSATAPGSGGMARGSGSAGSGSAAPIEGKDIDSKDILARTETTPEVYVKHVLLAWNGMTPPRGRLDPRAIKRSNAETAKLAQDIVAKLKENPDSIDQQMKDNSEDTGAFTGDPYLIKADTPFVPEFKNLSLRLKEKEVGIVKTAFGYHVVLRVPKPQPDPLEPADIIGRPGEPGPVYFQQILIGWKDTMLSHSGQGDKRASERNKADADKLVKEVADKARAKGADMAKLMKEYSEDPTAKDTGKVDNLGVLLHQLG